MAHQALITQYVLYALVKALLLCDTSEICKNGIIITFCTAHVNPFSYCGDYRCSLEANCLFSQINALHCKQKEMGHKRIACPRCINCTYCSHHLA